jgi:FAD/FMN-containing dehydrogenase
MTARARSEHGKLDAAAVETLRAGLRGQLIQPHDADYDTARKVYNAMIDRRPALIARCANVADVMRSVSFAREAGIPLAVRGGGHSGAGLGTCDGGLVIDLSVMRGVRVDPPARTVRVEGGATLGDVDHATHAFGLATPAGIISTTGVGGLTLGGGIGHLTRKYGLTIDNLLEVDIVLADGASVTANAEQHHDLFWAVRGGGGNFGVVTSFLFRLHPVGHVVAGPTLYPLEQASAVMRWYREFLPQAPEDLNGFFAFLTVPPAPPFPEALHLKRMCGIVWCYCGPADRADDVLKPAREFGPPALYGVQSMPYPVLQSAFDGLYPPGLQWYWRADFVNELGDEAIAVNKRFGAELPTLQSTMHLYPIDGAVHRAGRGATAFSYREAQWAQVIVGVSPDPSDGGRIRDWAVGYWEALHPYSAGGAYVNFMMEEGQERVRATYRDNYDRLAKVKRKYDPGNLFHINQNVVPAMVSAR